MYKDMLQVKALPKILSFGDLKYYVFSASFTALAVFVPWLLHRFQLVGPQFLPMHFFILIAGFLFGWRVGLVSAISSSLISYSVSHMPPLLILPEVTLELIVYGFTIGVLREKKLNIWFALVLAMLSGRMARLLFVFIFGFQTNPLKYFQTSWPGIILQLLLVPLIIYLLGRFLFERKNG